MSRFFPILSWLQTYRRTDFNGDLFAGIITAILLVPQGIAFGLLAGLPPQFGLYASILPPLVYAILGTSRTLSVGPVSIAAIMIAGALKLPEVSALGNPMQSAIILSAESGAILLLMAVCRMGSLVNFISHPVSLRCGVAHYRQPITSNVRFKTARLRSCIVVLSKLFARYESLHSNDEHYIFRFITIFWKTSFVCIKKNWFINSVSYCN
jgi:Sulfate permease family